MAWGKGRKLKPCWCQKSQFPLESPIFLLISGHRSLKWLLNHFPSTGKQLHETADASHFNQLFHYHSFFHTRVPLFLPLKIGRNIPIFLIPFWRLGKPLTLSEWWKNVFVQENSVWMEHFGSLGTDGAPELSNTPGRAALLKTLHTLSWLIALSINRNWAVPADLKRSLSTAVKVGDFHRAWSWYQPFQENLNRKEIRVGSSSPLHLVHLWLSKEQILKYVIELHA